MKTQKIEFTRINNDINGNPRYVCHFLSFLSNEESESIKQNVLEYNSNKPASVNYKSSINECYSLAVKKAKQLGGRKYHTKSYGGGIVFQSYNIQALEKSILELVK